MKKILAVIMVISLMATIFAGCSGGGGESAVSSEGTNSSTASTASSSTASGEKVNISFVNGFTGGDGAYMKKIVEGFNNSQDAYFIEELQTDDHYTKFKSDDFDMLIIHADIISTFYQDGLIQDVSAIYEKAGITSDDFHEVTKRHAIIDDKPYAFPLDIYMMTMFYNKEYVKEAPKTYDDLLALRDELDSQNSNIYVMGIPVTGDHQHLWTSFMYQGGINFSNDKNLVLDTEEVADTFLKINKMIYEDKISPSGLGANDHLNAFMKDDSDSSARTVLALMGPWNYTAAKERYGDNLGVATIPTMNGDTHKVSSGGHNFAVSSKVSDQAKLDGIAEFMKYAYTPENLVNWADAGQAPVHLKTMELVQQSPDVYVVANVNYEALNDIEMPPFIYNIREQIKYANSVVFGLVQSTEGLTKEALMVELENATKSAAELSERF